MAEKGPDPEPDAENRPALVPDYEVPATAGPPGTASPAGTGGPAGAARRARWRWAGVALGVLAHVAFMAVDLVQMSGQDSGYRGLAYAVLSAIGTPVLLVAGGVGTIWPASRQFGIGLLIGTGAGLVIFGGVCVAILAAGS